MTDKDNAAMKIMCGGILMILKALFPCDDRFIRPLLRMASPLSRFASEKVPLEREMACHLMSLAGVVEVGLGGWIGAFFRPSPGLVHRAAWGKPAAAVRTLEIKYTPVA